MKRGCCHHLQLFFPSAAAAGRWPPACLLHLARLIRQRHLLMADWLWDLMMIADGSILGTTQEVTGHASATACRAYTEQAWRVHASAAEIEIS